MNNLDQKIIGETVEGIKNARVTFLVGAGISLSRTSHIPPHSYMVREILEHIAVSSLSDPNTSIDEVEYFLNHKELSFHEDIFQIISKILGINDTVSLIKSGFDTDSFNIIHIQLAYLSAKFNAGIITSNFDKLLEQAHDSLESYELLYPDEQLNIIKVHSIVSDINSSRFIVSNTFETLSDEILKRINSNLKNKLLVVMGCGGADTLGVMPLLTNKLSRPEKIIWLTRNKSEFEVENNHELSINRCVLLEGALDDYLERVCKNLNILEDLDYFYKSQLSKRSFNNSNDWWKNNISLFFEQLPPEKLSLLPFLWVLMLEHIKLYNIYENDNDENSYEGMKALFRPDSSFSHVPDNQEAWNDLHKLTSDENRYVRMKAAYTLGFIFPNVPDKQKAWDDLHKLANDEDHFVKYRAASALGSAFSYLPDKEQAWNDLRRLSNDKSEWLRANSNYSLGKVSIFKACQAESEEDYRKELEKAIEYYEKVHESDYSTYSQFCLPFYRLFYTIIFRKEEVKNEVDKYLAEVKDAVRGSKSKKLLFEAVENLANALKKVQDPGNLDLQAKKGGLNFYRQYCDRAVELMIDTEESAPSATEVMRKGLPILDRKLKSLLEEIQEKAKTACRESKGTDTEEIVCAVSREVQKWEIGSQEEMTWNIENLIFALESSVPRVPTNQHIFDRIQQIREQKDIPKQYGMVSTLIPLIPKLCMEQKIDSIEKKLDDIIIHLSNSHTDLTISIGADFYGNGMKVTKTIPLQKFSDNEKEEIEGKIQGNEGVKLSSLSTTLVKKIKDHLF